MDIVQMAGGPFVSFWKAVVPWWKTDERQNGKGKAWAKDWKRMIGFGSALLGGQESTINLIWATKYSV